ncbi:MAG: 50S ribosomal protein L30 [Bacteroidales bacterium]|nr:50S ribosomal protein L30 [Bacteroidales bacterium]
MKKVKLTQIKSSIDRPLRQKRTLEALKLGRIGKSAGVECTPQIEGMIAMVNHLVAIEEA